MIRTDFDTQAQDPNSGIVTLDSGIIVDDPPASCQDGVFDARDNL